MLYFSREKKFQQLSFQLALGIFIGCGSYGTELFHMSALTIVPSDAHSHSLSEIDPFDVCLLDEYDESARVFKTNIFQRHSDEPK